MAQINPIPETGSPYVHSDSSREAMGVFSNPDQMQEAIRELESTAFPRDSISILGHRHTLEDRFGHGIADSDFVEDDPNAPREAPVRPEEQVIGASALVCCAAYIGVVSAGLAIGAASLPVTFMAIALGGGSGAALGGLLLSRIKYKYEQHIQEQLSDGGLLLWVRTPDAEREELACEILARHGAAHVRVHDAP